MNKTRRVWTAGAAAMLFAGTVGSAAFLTLSSPRADFMPEPSVWQNSLLPGVAEGAMAHQTGNSPSKGRNFLSMDFEAYGNAFSYGGGADRLAALDPAGGVDGNNRIGADNGSGGGGSSSGPHGQGDPSGPAAGSRGLSGTQPTSGGAGIPGTFGGGPSAWDTLNSELERSIEPPSRRGEGGDELAEFNPDDTMTPDPTEALPPIDQQPLPERPVPEPHSLALLLLGIAGLSALRYRRSA